MNKQNNSDTVITARYQVNTEDLANRPADISAGVKDFENATDFDIIEELCTNELLGLERTLTPSEIQTVKMVVEKYCEYNIRELLMNGQRDEAILRLESFLAIPAVSGSEKLSADLKDLITLIRRFPGFNFDNRYMEFNDDMVNLMAYYQKYVIEADRA